MLEKCRYDVGDARVGRGDSSRPKGHGTLSIQVGSIVSWDGISALCARRDAEQRARSVRLLSRNNNTKLLPQRSSGHQSVGWDDMVRWHCLEIQSQGWYRDSTRP